MRVINSTKNLIMKFIEDKSIILAFGFLTLFGLGFFGCNADLEEEVIPRTLEEHKTELSNIIASEKVVVQNCVVGYNKGDFKTELNYPEYTGDYMAALLEAEAVLAGTGITITDVIEANMAITPPGKLFNDNIWISDRRPIHELIVFSDTLRVHTPVGTEVGSAPQEAHDQFSAAISSAKSVRSRSSAIDRQITEAVEKLDPELEIFQEAIVK